MDCPSIPVDAEATTPLISERTFVVLHSTVDGMNTATLGTPRTPENPSQTKGIDPRSPTDRWISVGGGVLKPTPAVGEHPGVLPV